MGTTPYPQTLESHSCLLIVALSDTEIGKVILPSKLVWVNTETGKPFDLFNENPTVQSEATALQYANSINDLMPRFIRKQTWQTKDGKEHDMLVMERLYPLPIHHFDLSVRTGMVADFEVKFEALHDGHFVHGDLVRPTNPFNRGDLAWMFSNVVQTEGSLRLIDAGFSAILQKNNVKEFVHTLFRERNEIKYFRSYYLSEILDE